MALCSISQCHYSIASETSDFSSHGVDVLPWMTVGVPPCFDHGVSVVSTPGFAMLPASCHMENDHKPEGLGLEGFQILAATCMLRVPHIII